jgi:drug/metabolite transporter (DMT)-like permease
MAVLNSNFPSLRVRRSSYFFLFLMILIFSPIFIFSKQIIPPLNSVTYLFWRYFIATLFYLVLLSITHTFQRVWALFRQYPKDIFVLGIVLQTIPLLLIFAATPFTTASNQIIINNFTLAAVIIFNRLIRKKSPGKLLITAALLNFAGILLIMWPLNFAQNPTLVGDLLMLLGVILGSLFVIKMKYVAEKIPSLDISFFLSILTSSSLFLVMIIFFPASLNPLALNLSPIQWFYLLFLGIIVSGFGYWIVAQIYSDPNLSPSTISLFSSLIPIGGFILSITIFGESLYFINAVGAILVLLSVFLGSRDRSQTNK